MMISDFHYSWVADPQVFRQNCLPAHSDHIYFQKEPGDCRVSLNGPWFFSYAETWDKSIKGFEQPEYDCRSWEEIPVPAHIQLQGYDLPQYVNYEYPWDGHEEIRPGQIPERFNPTASYVKYFHVPVSMTGQRLFLSFQGVESAFALWMNGHYIGYSEDSFTPADFELTPFLVNGENKLAVQVFKWSSGSWCEDQDFFRFSGIFRDVFLYIKPLVHVDDLRIRTELTDDFRSAVVQLDLNICFENMWETGALQMADVPGNSSVTSSNIFGSAEITLTDAGRNVIAGERHAFTGSGQPLETGLRAGSHTGRQPEFRAGSRDVRQISQQIHIPVSAPRLWSAEDPYLYSLEIRMHDACGNTVETVTEKVGFRRVEIKNSVLLLNGKRLVFRGVNRHEFCASAGRVEEEPEGIRISYTYFPAFAKSVTCCLSYLIHPDGSIDVEQSMNDAYGCGELPEFSVLWPLSPDLQQIAWYGPGPEETYRDRPHGRLGCWQGTVAGQMARYLRPQECGWKENARWMRVTDKNGRGLLFEAPSGAGMGISALPYTPYELDNADHPNELPDPHHTWVRIGMQMGVGGDDTWGALVHPEYRLDPSRELRICFRVRGIDDCSFY